MILDTPGFVVLTEVESTKITRTASSCPTMITALLTIGFFSVALAGRCGPTRLERGDVIFDRVLHSALP